VVPVCAQMQEDSKRPTPNKKKGRSWMEYRIMAPLESVLCVALK
jgi:hypothetical protein